MTKKVPVKRVPAAPMWQFELANKPAGRELIVQDVSPLLNWPGGKFAMVTVTVWPGAPGKGPEKAKIGVSSTLNAAGDRTLESPLLPVTRIV